MLILGVDTATLVASVALTTAETMIAEITIQTTKNHSVRLMPQIAELLLAANVSQQQIDAIAVSNGPGSFTGLRIGLSTAKALAYAWEVPIIGVSTLAALAYQVAVPGVIVSPLLDAQKNNVYQGLYYWKNGRLQELMEPRVVSGEQALAEMDRLDHPVIIMGEVPDYYRKKITAMKKDIVLAKPFAVMPRAATVAALGLEQLQQGVEHDVFSLEPIYIRRSEAEVLWEKRYGNNECQ